MKRKEKIDLLEGIRAGKKDLEDLIDPKFYILYQGKITEFHPNSPNPEVSPEQFCKVFRPQKDTLGKGASGIPPQGVKTDPSGITMKKIIEHFPELDTPENRDYIHYCDNLEQRCIERYGEEIVRTHQAECENKG